ncbi:MAG: hypothetical protein IKO56_03735 [Alphaproteobacteria bacterium]|nr:hypothetical protein [Alphaproteobacteria bacterium]
MEETVLHTQVHMVEFVQALLKKTENVKICWEKINDGFACPFVHGKKIMFDKMVDDDGNTTYFISFATADWCEYKFFYSAEDGSESRRSLLSDLEKLDKAIVKNVDDQFQTDMTLFLTEESGQ